MTTYKLKHHTICEGGLEIRLVGDFDVLNLTGKSAGPVAAVLREEHHLCAAGGGVSDKMNSLGWYVGQQAYS